MGRTIVLSHSDSSDGYVGLTCSTILWLLQVKSFFWGYSAATVTGATMHARAAENPENALKGVLQLDVATTCSTYTVGQRNLDMCVTSGNVPFQPKTVQYYEFYHSYLYDLWGSEISFDIPFVSLYLLLSILRCVWVTTSAKNQLCLKLGPVGVCGLTFAA